MTSIRGAGLVEFRFYRPDAQRVCVAGDFNGWNPNAWEMHNDGNGWWRAEAQLRPGEYRFRYVADSQWHTDYAASGIERGKFGWESILWVPPAHEAVAAARRAAQTTRQVAASALAAVTVQRSLA
jgi:1,4-alpha-glucan branching enzyme